MKLPHSLEKLNKRKLTRPQLIREIKERRRVIRRIRDAKGDHRCWVDIFWIFQFLDDSAPEPELPSFKDGMLRCALFFKFCRTKTIDKPGDNAIFDRRLWNRDLDHKSDLLLLLELNAIQLTFRDFRDVGRPHIVSDYYKLVGLLYENIGQDFRLPSKADFLGRRKAPKAGCPAFWESHRRCKGRHNIHNWGPCPKNGACH